MHIDWSTLALQTVNVLVLVWLLARFLFRPVRTIIDERRAAADRLLADAAAARAQTEAGDAEIKARLRDLSAEAERMLVEARSRAEDERARVLGQETDAVTHLRDEAKAAIEIDRVTMERVLRCQACDLAIVIARRLVGRLPAKAATAAQVEALAARVAELPDEARAGPIEIVTAVPLDDNQQAACRTFLGDTSRLVFRTDPALIAGVELHTPGLLIRDSWQADLERIAAELNQEERHEARSEQLV
jgi:F-type H+-transporting ATPase subunit b